MECASVLSLRVTFPARPIFLKRVGKGISDNSSSESDGGRDDSTTPSKVKSVTFADVVRGKCKD